MRLIEVELRDFRCYERASAPLGEGLTVVTGENGAGKSNLLEAICFGCTGRSPRTRNDRELIRFGAEAAHVCLRLREIEGESAGGNGSGGSAGAQGCGGRAERHAGRDGRAEEHELAVGFGLIGEDRRLQKRMSCDRAEVSSMRAVAERPLVSVFAPDRLSLVNGPPALRRSHLDNLVSALWPSRSDDRVEYAHALAQRNALVMRMSSARSADSTLEAWDMRLAGSAVRLMEGRQRAVEVISPAFRGMCEVLRLDGEMCLDYRARVPSTSVEGFCEQLSRHLAADLERGHTTCGPHRDELAVTRDGRPLRTYASQGERRLALLALLMAEREALQRARREAPLLLLDDVLSELDEQRRGALLGKLREAEGQCVIAATELRELRASEGAATESRGAIAEVEGWMTHLKIVNGRIERG